MQPEQPQYQPQPESQPQPQTQPQASNAVPQMTDTAPPISAVASKKRKKQALWLLIGPSALFVVALAVGVLSANFLEPDAAFMSLVNIFIFLSSAVVVITWLPGMIIGFILLAKNR